MRLLVWNAEWAKPSSRAGNLIRDEIIAQNPDVICLTEGSSGLLPLDGYIVEAGGECGYSRSDGGRKVMLWSRRPVDGIQIAGLPGMPEGRYCSFVLDGVCVVGVCIPWKSSHVSTGNRNRKIWEDHLAYLNGLGSIVRDHSEHGGRLVVCGDFNQRIPRQKQPESVYEALEESVLSWTNVATSGWMSAISDYLIDHVAVDRAAIVGPMEIIPSRLLKKRASFKTGGKNIPPVFAYKRPACGSHG